MINSRAKGQRGEREWVEYFKRWWPNCSRGLSQTAGASTPDVDGTPFWVECKIGKRINLFAAYEQAKSDLAKEQKKGRYLDLVPIVCARQDRKDGVVMMSAETFAELLERAYPVQTISHEEIKARMNAKPPTRTEDSRIPGATFELAGHRGAEPPSWAK